MRPQQQNRRMRGRNNNGGSNNNNNNNRGSGGGGKGGPNPLTRSYESNGPDVKIRGNAQQIAEKYTTLARDSHSSGDRVMAENYLQHAEHYNRIIAAAQASMPIQQAQQNRDDFDDEDGDERDDFDGQGNVGGDQQPNGEGYGSGPQPVIEGVPAEVALNGENGGQGGDNQQPRNRDGFRNRDRNNREGNRDGQPREGRERNRDFQNRNGNGNGDYQRRDFQPRDEQRGDGEVRTDQQPAARTFDKAPVEEAIVDALPSFLTQAVPVPAASPEEAPRRTRRPRRGEPVKEASTDVAPEGDGLGTPDE